MLFDLDGTLLAIDTEAFIRRYMKRLGEYTAAIIDPDVLVTSLWTATKHVIADEDAATTNAQVFEEVFLKLCNLSRDEIWPSIDRFYEEEFPLLREDIQPHPATAKVVEEAKRQGYKLVIATNAVFPEAAIMERMKWAGIDASSFDWVTVFENSHFCKPNPKYYEEICEQIGMKPEQCIMIGNDMQQDMVASEIGMRTFFVTDYKIDRGAPQYRVDASGTLDQFGEQLTSRSGIFSVR